MQGRKGLSPSQFDAVLEVLNRCASRKDCDKCEVKVYCVKMLGRYAEITKPGKSNDFDRLKSQPYEPTEHYVLNDGLKELIRRL